MINTTVPLGLSVYRVTWMMIQDKHKFQKNLDWLSCQHYWNMRWETIDRKHWVSLIKCFIIITMLCKCTFNCFWKNRNVCSLRCPQKASSRIELWLSTEDAHSLKQHFCVFFPFLISHSSTLPTVLLAITSQINCLNLSLFSELIFWITRTEKHILGLNCCWAWEVEP